MVLGFRVALWFFAERLYFVFGLVHCLMLLFSGCCLPDYQVGKEAASHSCNEVK